MCIFHQKMIIRRYITANPKTDCGIDLKQLTDNILYDTPEDLPINLLLLKTNIEHLFQRKIM